MSKLSEQITSYLQEVYGAYIELKEFANPQKDVKKSIINLSDNIIEHIVKIIIFGSQTPNTIHHWEAEIFAGLKECQRQKIKGRGGNCYPNSYQLNTWLNELYSEDDSMIGLTGAIESHYLELTNNKDYKLVWQQEQQILQELIMLTVNQKLTIKSIDDVFTKVLGDNYDN